MASVQSILFPKHLWGREAAVNWALKHGYAAKKVDTDRHYHRLRQREPSHDERCSRKTIISRTSGKPIVLLLCGPSKARKR
jgi:hypothetical protein